MDKEKLFNEIANSEDCFVNVELKGWRIKLDGRWVTPRYCLKSFYPSEERAMDAINNEVRHEFIEKFKQDFPEFIELRKQYNKSIDRKIEKEAYRYIASRDIWSSFIVSNEYREIEEVIQAYWKMSNDLEIPADLEYQKWIKELVESKRLVIEFGKIK